MHLEISWPEITHRPFADVCNCPQLFSRKEPRLLRLLTFETQQCTAACAKDFGQGEVTWSVVWKCLADTLSNSQHLPVSTGLLGFMPCLSGYNVPECKHMCLGNGGWGGQLTVMHYKCIGECPPSVQIVLSTNTNVGFTHQPSHYAG